jgi:hypothetical protein
MKPMPMSSHDIRADGQVSRRSAVEQVADTRMELRDALNRADHNAGFHKLDEFAEYVVTALRKGELVEYASWAQVDYEDGMGERPKSLDIGFLTCTTQRLLFLWNFFYSSPPKFLFREKFVRMSIDRADIDNVTKSRPWYSPDRGLSLEIKQRTGSRAYAYLGDGTEDWWLTKLRPEVV